MPPQFPESWPISRFLVLVDAGARGGPTDLRRLASRTAVYGLEPHPAAYAALISRRERSYAAEHYFPLALAGRAGEVVLHLSRNPSYSSLLPVNWPVYERHLRWMRRYPEWRQDIEPVASLAVPATTLDQFAEDQGLQRIDLLKLDTQGTEFRILQGAQSLLARGAIGVIRCEVSFLPWYEGQHVFADIDHFLRQWGFEYVDCRFDKRVVFHSGDRTAGKTSPIPGVYDPTRYSGGGDAVYFLDPARLPLPDRRPAALATGMALAEMRYIGPAYDLWTRYEALPRKEIMEWLRFFAHRSWRRRLRDWGKGWLPPVLREFWRKTKG